MCTVHMQLIWQGMTIFPPCCWKMMRKYPLQDLENKVTEIKDGQRERKENFEVVLSVVGSGVGGWGWSGKEFRNLDRAVGLLVESRGLGDQHLSFLWLSFATPPHPHPPPPNRPHFTKGASKNVLGDLHRFKLVGHQYVTVIWLH